MLASAQLTKARLGLCGLGPGLLLLPAEFEGAWTAARISSSVNGCSMKSTAPALIARTASGRCHIQ